MTHKHEGCAFSLRSRGIADVLEIVGPPLAGPLAFVNWPIAPAMSRARLCLALHLSGLSDIR